MAGESATPPAAPQRAKPVRPLPVKILRGLAWALIGVVGLAASLLLAVQLVLRTPYAEEKIASVADAQLRKLLAGKLTLGRVLVEGALRVCVRDVSLDDPDGVPAIRAKQICAKADLIAAVHRQIHLESVALDQPLVFLTSEPGAGGVATSSLSRALALRNPSPPSTDSTPFAWSILLDKLSIHGGAFEMRDAPGAQPTLAVHGLELDDAAGRYAQSGAQAKVGLSAELRMEGAEKVQVSVDAGVDGDVTQGKLTLRSLEAHLGSSGFKANGDVDLTTFAGNLGVRDLLLEPADLNTLLGPLPLAAELRGEAELSSDGKVAHTALHVETVRGGRIGLIAQSTIASKPRWSVRLETEHVDPAFVLRGAPEGAVSLALELAGSGIPKLDARGVEGDVGGTLHVGPAQLKEIGALSADATFSLQGKTALVKTLDADALAVHVKGSGAVSATELGLQLQIDAADLARFARALGALQKEPPIAMTGSAHLDAHVTGSPRKPDAQLHLRSPTFTLGAGLRVQGLAVDGALVGPLERPHGTLDVSSTALQLAGIGLAAPKVVAQVDWPKAHVQLDAQVGQSFGDEKQEGGQIHVAGDAQVDEDRDGAVLTGFVVSWPGNELKQEQVTRVHFRRTETVLEPLELKGAHGALSLAATVTPPAVPPPGQPKKKAPGPTRVDAQVSLAKFELGSLPAFALPPDLRLAGVVDLRATLSGSTSDPDVKATASLRGVAVRNLKGVDGELAAQLEHDHLRAQGSLTNLAGTALALKANIPIEADAAGSSPLELDLSFGPLDLTKLPDVLQRQDLFLARPAGLVTLHVTAQGTLDRPRAQAVVEAKDVAWGNYKQLGLRAELVAEGGRARLNAGASVAATQAVSLTADAPFDLTASLRKPALFAHVFDKPASAKVSVPGLELALLATAGIAPEGTSGRLVAELALSGTEAAPQLSAKASVKQLNAGALRGLDAALDVAIAQKLHMDLEGRPGGEARAKATLDAQLSAAELLGAARKGFAKESLGPLLDRPLALELDVDKVLLGSVSSQGKAQLPLRGELQGRVTGSGSANAPLLKGKLTLRDVEAGVHQLGDAEITLDANQGGASAQLKLAPPSAQELQARLRAEALASKQAGLDGGTAQDAGPAPEPSAPQPEPIADTRDAGTQAGSPDGGAAMDSSPVQKAQAAAAKKQGADRAAEAKAAERAKAAQARKDAQRGSAAKDKDGETAKTPAQLAKEEEAQKERAHNGGTFTGHATLRAPLSARALLDQGSDSILEGDLDGSVSMKDLDLAFLSGLTPLLRSTAGVMDGEVTLHGLLGRPEPKGELHLRDGSFDVVGQGIFDDVSFDATLTERRIVLSHISGTTGGGTFSATATVDRHDGAGDEDDEYEFKGEAHAGDAASVQDRKDADGKPLVARPVPIRQAGEVRGDLAAEVDFSGDDTAGNITAQIKIPSAKIHVASLPDKKLPALSPNPDVLVFNRGQEPHPAGIDTEEVKRQKAAIAASNLRVDVRLDLDKLDVKANDFEFPVTSKMHATWDAQHPDDPSADGTVEVKGGTFSALGRRFSIDSAKITETGGDIADPELEIQARYENAQASVLVLISGTAKDPQIDLSSSPPMDQDAIAFFLATGRLQGEATTQGSGVDLGNAATSVVGALLFGKLRSNMRDILPVDTVDIEAGGGDRPPEASVGKYIGDRIFIGYRQRFSPAPTENENEATVEYEISRGLGASATVGEKNQGVMVTYTKDF